MRFAARSGVIAKGNLHGDGARLARYLMAGKDGERAELVELTGFMAANLRDAFAETALHAEATRCTKPFFHAYVRLPAGERLTPAQWWDVAGRVGKQLGFADQPRAMVLHHGAAGAHLHIAWSRIDLERMRGIDPGLYKNKLKQLCRDLEREFGLTRISSARRSGCKTRAPGRKEFEQGRRLGVDAAQIREQIRAAWDAAGDGRGFRAALATRGLRLARGDRRDFVVIDHAGGVHALSKRITGAPAAAVRARLASTDREQLPGVAAARARPGARVMTFRMVPRLGCLPATAYRHAAAEETRRKFRVRRRRKSGAPIDDEQPLPPFNRPEWESARIIAEAFSEGRIDVLAQYDIFLATLEDG